MRWRSFFKTMVIGLFLATACLSGAYANGEKDGLSCEKGSACSPMMDAWCQQNGLTIDKNKEAGHYKYVNPINCTNPLCCIDASMYECERVQRKRARSKEDQIECRQNIHFGGGGIIDCDWEYYYMFRCKSVMQPDNPMSIITCKDQLFTSTLKSCTGGHTCYTIERHGWSGSKTGSIKYVSCVKSGETAETEGISLFVESLLDIDTSGCWLCPLLEEIFVMGDKLATAIYEQISVAMLLFLGVWAALLLLWLVFRAFVDFSGKEVRSFLQKSGALFLRIAVVATLLAVTPRIFGEWFYDPFISLSSGLGLRIINGTGETNHPQITYLTKNWEKEDSIMGCTNEEYKEFWKRKDLMFAKGACNSLVGLVDVMSTELLTPIQFGQTLMRWSVAEKKWITFLKFMPFLTGLIMVAFFFWALIMLPFKIIDIFVQLAVVGCLTPIALTLFAFPATRGYAQGVWKMFLSCMIQLVMLSLMVALAVALFIGTIDQGVLGLFLANKNEEAFNALGLGGTNILVTLALAFIAVQLLNKAADFAQQLGGAVNPGIGQTVETGVQWASARTAGLVGGAVWEGTTHAVRPVFNMFKRNRPDFEATLTSNIAARVSAERAARGGTFVPNNPKDAAVFADIYAEEIQKTLEQLDIV